MIQIGHRDVNVNYLNSANASSYITQSINSLKKTHSNMNGGGGDENMGSQITVL